MLALQCAFVFPSKRIGDFDLKGVAVVIIFINVVLVLLKLVKVDHDVLLLRLSLVSSNALKCSHFMWSSENVIICIKYVLEILGRNTKYS